MHPTFDEESQLAQSQFAHLKTTQPSTTASGITPGRALFDPAPPEDSPAVLDRPQRTRKPSARKAEASQSQPATSKSKGKGPANPTVKKPSGKNPGNASVATASSKYWITQRGTNSYYNHNSNAGYRYRHGGREHRRHQPRRPPQRRLRGRRERLCQPSDYRLGRRLCRPRHHAPLEPTNQITPQSNSRNSSVCLGNSGKIDSDNRATVCRSATGGRRPR
ncbi:hypothetical protein BDV93DRAFT_66668 [Ceratobasidium sp. AG-I]|nr:hypothetical protein BDV93DRAFT_66668 [Ceratobasidium sp. AG-I]